MGEFGDEGMLDKLREILRSSVKKRKIEGRKTRRSMILTLLFILAVCLGWSQAHRRES